jgi:hypothetical protein
LFVKLFPTLHKGRSDRFEESVVVVTSVLCDIFYMGDFHPLLDSVVSGE